MLSKELLKEVINKHVEYIKVDGDFIVYDEQIQIFGGEATGEESTFPTHYSKINIYQLAHKCKEWLWEKHRTELYEEGFRLYIEYKGKSIFFRPDLDFENNSVVKVDIIIPYDVRLIFKACEWILEQTNKLSNN